MNLFHKKNRNFAIERLEKNENMETTKNAILTEELRNAVKTIKTAFYEANTRQPKE